MDAEKMMMQRRIDNLMEQLELVKRQRDAAVHDLNMACCCAVCVKGMDKDYISNDCVDCDGSINFVWRGLCAENGGVEDGKD